MGKKTVSYSTYLGSKTCNVQPCNSAKVCSNVYKGKRGCPGATGPSGNVNGTVFTMTDVVDTVPAADNSILVFRIDTGVGAWEGFADRVVVGTRADLPSTYAADQVWIGTGQTNAGAADLFVVVGNAAAVTTASAVDDVAIGNGAVISSAARATAGVAIGNAVDLQTTNATLALPALTDTSGAGLTSMSWAVAAGVVNVLYQNALGEIGHIPVTLS